MNWLAVFVGGGLGSLCRYGLAVLYRNQGWNITWATFTANLLASIVLALGILFLHQRMPNQPLWQTLLITGFCGGFSTFSTFSYETTQLIRSGEWMWAAGNVLVSVLACVGVIWFILSR